MNSPTFVEFGNHKVSVSHATQVEIYRFLMVTDPYINKNTGNDQSISDFLFYKLQGGKSKVRRETSMRKHNKDGDKSEDDFMNLSLLF